MIIKYILDSSFYSKSFDGAIFDGPYRLYFAQHQETFGLELYHHLIHSYTSYSKSIKSLNKKVKRNVYLLMYPSSIDKSQHQPRGDINKVFITPFKSDYIIGFSQEAFSKDPLCLKTYLSFICENWVMSASNKVNTHFKNDFLIHLD